LLGGSVAHRSLNGLFRLQATLPYGGGEET
jgi:hypothetical protein